MEPMTKAECMKEATDDLSRSELESLWDAIKSRDLMQIGMLNERYLGHAIKAYEDQFTSENARDAAVDEEIKRRKMGVG